MLYNARLRKTEKKKRKWLRISNEYFYFCIPKGVLQPLVSKPLYQI